MILVRNRQILIFKIFTAGWQLNNMNFIKKKIFFDDWQKKENRIVRKKSLSMQKSAKISVRKTIFEIKT